jgi:hypothetical protein
MPKTQGTSMGKSMQAAPAPHTHMAELHPSALSPHAIPQPPQFDTSLSTLRQTPVQHAPPAPHARPHAPQFEASFVVSMQVPPQQLRPAPQAGPAPHRHAPSTQASPTAHAGVHIAVPIWQRPLTHVCPVMQATPQPPQFEPLDVMSTHVPPQHPCPAAHPAPAPQRHPPSVHVSPGLHAGMQSGA